MRDQRLSGGVESTAVGIARVRAEESRRHDRLFDDPYAVAFVRAATGEPPPGPEPRQRGAAGAAMAARIVLRTRFFDDYLLRAAGAGCRQVVLLAAGLDARAFRLAWPRHTRLFELDLPHVVAFKEDVLRQEQAVPACERTVVPADLRGAWGAELAGAGFDPAARTAWLIEGLLVYLDAADADALLTEVGRLSAPGSRLSLTEGHLPSRLIVAAGMSQEYRSLTGLWKGGLSEPAGDWLPRNGWRVTPHRRDDLENAFGRSGPEAFSGGFVVAERGGQAPEPGR